MRHNYRWACFAVLWACATLLGCTGCAAYPRVPCPPRVAPALGEMRDGYGVVNLLFATDRRPTGASAPAVMFGVERTRSLTYGRCSVSIPAGHRLGGVDEAGLFGRDNPARNVVLLSADITDQPKRNALPAAFLKELRERVAQSPHKEIFVFIHGYAATFEDAARETAQLAHDIGFDGVPILYTWPTRGLYLSYLVDSNNAEWTVPYFVGLLETLVNESGAERIHLMAHSMGTRVLARGLRAYALRHTSLRGRAAGTSEPAPGDRPAFDQVILAAADIDAEIFERDFVPAILTAARRTTIYMSSNDMALGLALRLNGYFRLGQSDLPDVDLAALKRIDVVDVTEFDRDFFGHFYHNQCPRVLEDLAAVLGTGAAPEDMGDPTADAPEADKSARRLQRTFYYRMKP